MKNLIKISLFVFSIFVIQTTLAYATGYNYLPNDVYIKQQEEKSALEYRLQKLEAGISNNSSSLLSSISSRISQLESERATEKNYISGTYAHLGIANQLQAKLDEIDRKYDSQISSLRNQQSSHENTISSQQSKETEISNLKLQIAQLKAQMVDQELQTNLKALEKYQTQKQATIEDLYNWLETLPADEWVEKLELLRQMNPENYRKIEELYHIYHPEFFSSSSKDISVSNTPKQTVNKPKIETLQKSEKTVVKQEEKKIDIKPIALEEKSISQIPVEQQKPQIEQIQEQKPVQVKTTFKQKISGFFKRIFGIK